MSGADNNNIVTEVQITCCASCGKSELDDVKLMECADCKSVRYCSNDCQNNHRPEHEAKCKERAAELRDEILFRQPESTHLGDCPICCLPLCLQMDQDLTTMYPCCSKWVCNGCALANDLRQERETIGPLCPFCRHSLSGMREEDRDRGHQELMKRAAANDPFALCVLGKRLYDNKRLYDKGEYVDAIEYYTKAAAMGDADAHCELAHMYRMGRGVEKDEKKERYHLEEASIRGHPIARFKIGCLEVIQGLEYERAVKHWIIGANLGSDDAMNVLKEYYEDELVSKEDFAAALRAHCVASNAMKSPQREEAARADAAREIT